MNTEPRQEFSNPHRGLNKRGASVVIIVAVFWTIATVSVALRFYARRIKKSMFMIEDWLVLGALIIFYGFGSGDIMLVVFGGSGWHVHQVNPAQLKNAQKVLLGNQMLYGIGLGLIKCSITIMLIRIFSVPRFRIAGYIVLAACVAWVIMTILIAFLICRPLGYNWNLQPTAGHCGNTIAAYTAVGVADIITDLMILDDLEIAASDIEQSSVSSFDVLRFIVSLHTYYLAQSLTSNSTIGMSIARVVTILNTDFSDFTYNLYNDIWPAVEFGVAIFVCCGPLLRPLLTPVFGSLASIRSRLGSRQDSKLQSSTTRRNGYHGFTHLNEDGLPLHSVGEERNTNTASNTTSITTDARQDRKMSAHGASSPSNKGIVVETAWNFA
ncbi:integral membrane protein [Rutstroemia sp. NJR-2017a BBW]|nr:integral membrane protein [Rutstroemia sp. NJR-2017a BBW]